MQMDVTYDLYKDLDLDRSWDEATIKQKLKEIQKFWILRQNACNDKEQSLIIDKALTAIRDGFRILIKPEKRAEYDKALDAAYQSGALTDEIEEQMRGLLDRAREYYKKGNIRMAAQCAQDAINGRVNDPAGYEILAQCYKDVGNFEKALETVDAGTKVFPDDIQLIWFGARVATVGMQDYDNAQKRINHLMQVAPDSSIGHTEQIFMHLRKGEEDLAFQEVDAYVAAHPEDEEYKQRVAYDICAYSNSCYYHDEKDGAMYIADKESYDKCLKLRKKAADLYHDEHTQDRLEDAQYYGQKQWDSWNIDSIKYLSIYGIIFLFLAWPIGLILLAINALVIAFSFRPYWQINKTYVTGQRGTLESIVNVLGSFAATAGKWTFGFIWRTALALVRFSIDLATGGLFR